MRDSLQFAIPAVRSATKEPSTLGNEVFEKLRQDILSSRLQPGTKLRFQSLRDAYGVGLSPLREALSRLAENRLVVATGQRGFRVAAVSVHDILDIAMVRKQIESVALRLSIENGDDSWEARMVAAHHRIILAEKAGKKVDEEEWEQRHRDFHYELVSCCNSPCLLHIHQLLSDLFDRYRRLSTRSGVGGAPRTLMHQKIVDAALSRNVEATIKLMADHIDEATKLIVEALSRPPGREARRKVPEPIAAPKKPRRAVGSRRAAMADR